MKKTLLCLALGVGATLANAQTSLVQDIYPGMTSSNPGYLTEYHGMLMFSANDGINGNELWMMDASGLSLVYNINPGPNSSMGYSPAGKMVMVDSVLYFAANDGTNGYELYKWPGMGQPSIVKDIRTGSASSNVGDMAEMDGKLFFNAYGNTGGAELWVYDPSTDNAQQLSDIYPGTGSSNPQNLISFKGKLFFTAYEPGIGYELYMYDPTTNNTSMVVDLYSGSGSSYPSNFMIWDNKLYFIASTPLNGSEIYMMENTTPVRITDVNAGNGSSILSTSGGATMIAWNKMLYFTATDGSSDYQIFKYNPANGTTSLVYKVNPISSSVPYGYIEYANKLYFAANDGNNGTELWMYDGQSAPQMVADIWGGPNSSSPYGLTIHDSTLYFSAMDSATGRELYRMYDSAVGIQNVRFEADINVYPNPATSAVNLDIDLKSAEKLAIRMTDVTGKVVYINDMKQYNTGNNRITIPMHNMAAGVYYYNIIGSDGAGYFAGKVLKQ